MAVQPTTNSHLKTNNALCCQFCRHILCLCHHLWCWQVCVFQQLLKYRAMCFATKKRVEQCRRRWSLNILHLYFLSQKNCAQKIKIICTKKVGQMPHFLFVIALYRTLGRILLCQLLLRILGKHLCRQVLFRIHCRIWHLRGFCVRTLGRICQVFLLLLVLHCS